MPKYIDFDIVLHKLGTWYYDVVGIYGNNEDFAISFDEAMDELADVPAADVEEIRHAKWVHYGEDIQCSNCLHVSDDICFEGDMDSGYYTVLPRYCSNCGAKMDLEDK